jgi:hypothetical protein
MISNMNHDRGHDRDLRQELFGLVAVDRSPFSAVVGNNQRPVRIFTLPPRLAPPLPEMRHVYVRPRHDDASDQ